MIGNASSNFFDIIIIGERIKHGVKIRKIVDNSMEIMGAKKPMFNKKMEGEVHATHATSYER